ncbi:MAG: alpha/beta fold hydrolase, partial [Catenulispora sp.]|nr:alpha/beta fold hydrolase [Catenulispora sp.]
MRVAVAESIDLNIREYGDDGRPIQYGDDGRPLEQQLGHGDDGRHRQQGGGGRHFLLVHGLASNARLWDQVAAYLVAAGHRAWAVDLRGHGESDLPDGDVGTATAAADLAVVCERLGLDRVIVAGQSWGGNVAVRFAAEHPDLVAGLALVDGGWIDLAADFPSWAACAKALRPPEIDGAPAGQLEGYLRSAHPDWSDDAIAATAFNLRVRPDGTVERRLPVERHMEIVRDMWEHPVTQYFGRITMPAVLLPAYASDDPGRAGAKREHVAGAAAAMADARVH